MGCAVMVIVIATKAMGTGQRKGLLPVALFFTRKIHRKEGSRMPYSIGEIAKMLGVSRESLRSWEKQGLIPKPHRRPTNIREYTDEGIKAIKQFLERRN